MLNWIVRSRTAWWFNCAFTNDWCLIELLVIQSNTWSHCWLMLNWIVRSRTFWSFNCVLTNDWCLIELLVIHSSTWNNLTLLTLVYKSYISNCHSIVFRQGQSEWGILVIGVLYVQQMWFPKLLAKNNPSQIDIPLKSINHFCSVPHPMIKKDSSPPGGVS